MKSITLLAKRVLVHRYLAISILFSLAIISWRVIYTGQPTYIFLVWNLMLAFIPFAISELGFNPNKKVSAFSNVLALLGCVAFLPNSPYIITDLFHLRWHTAPSIWYDTVLIVSFAWNGMLLFFHTLINLDEKLLSRFGKVSAWTIKLIIIGLCAFGIYLGRYLRFNSWDVISDPYALIYEIGHRVLYPFQHPLTWSMTVLYTLFLVFTYLNFVGFRRADSAQQRS